MRGEEACAVIGGVGEEFFDIFIFCGFQCFEITGKIEVLGIYASAVRGIENEGQGRAWFFE